MNREDGFTLLEMLFVLSILSVFILISLKLNTTSLDKMKEKQFFELLESDVLYIQSITSQTSNKVRMRFSQNRYVILSEMNETYASRKYPDKFTLGSGGFHTIVFDITGTIIGPGTITFKSKDIDYRIVFPFGKGRFYIAQE